MPWECAECHIPEGQGTRIDAVCHHCGKPLCQEDRVVFADNAFAVSARTAGAEAVHCRACRREYHPRGEISL